MAGNTYIAGQPGPSASLGAIRRGMWVIHNKRIGIAEVDDIGAPVVHYVDAKGDTTLIVPCDPAKLTQAALEDIPEARRPEPEHGAKFGYV
jgi:hypothetical protein